MKEKTENEIFSFSERVIKDVVKRDDEHTKQVIKDYLRERYPKKNIRIDFLDEEIVNQIIELGIAEYQKRQALGGVLSERK
ncbi:unknown [Clostridium sp. CAG:575]|nr:unknown [Clostridium sp. CAG:575]